MAPIVSDQTLPKVDENLDKNQKTNSTLRTRYEAIEICEEKYRGEFRRKKWITMAIAVAGIAMLIIPAVALAITAFSATTFSLGLAIAIPLVIVLASLLVKKIEKKTHYWSGNLAENLLLIKEDEERRKAKKLQEKMVVKEEPI